LMYIQFAINCIITIYPLVPIWSKQSISFKVSRTRAVFIYRWILIRILLSWLSTLPMKLLIVCWNSEKGTYVHVLVSSTRNDCCRSRIGIPFAQLKVANKAETSLNFERDYLKPNVWMRDRELYMSRLTSGFKSIHSQPATRFTQSMLLDKPRQTTNGWESD
jgi:hypothetical protein